MTPDPFFFVPHLAEVETSIFAYLAGRDDYARVREAVESRCAGRCGFCDTPSGVLHIVAQWDITTPVMRLERLWGVCSICAAASNRHGDEAAFGSYLTTRLGLSPEHITRALRAIESAETYADPQHVDLSVLNPLGIDPITTIQRVEAPHE